MRISARTPISMSRKNIYVIEKEIKIDSVTILLKDGRAIKRTNESRLVLCPNSKVLGQNKAPPCRAGRAEIGPRLTFQSRRTSARAQESS